MGTLKNSNPEDKSLSSFKQTKNESDDALNKKNLDSLKGGAGHEYTYSKNSGTGGTATEE